jgi:hypothetical protein
MDGRTFVAIGCTDGIWIGLEHDPKSMRKVLHLKMVTQCAALDDFGVLLALADGVRHFMLFFSLISNPDIRIVSVCFQY